MANHQAREKETVDHLNVTTKEIIMVEVVTVVAALVKTVIRMVRETITQMQVEAEVMPPKGFNSSNLAKLTRKTNGITLASMRFKMSNCRSLIANHDSSMTNRREGKVVVANTTKGSLGTAAKAARKVVMEVIPTLSIIRLGRSKAITLVTSNRLSNNNRIFTRKTEMKNLNKISSIQIVFHSKSLS